MTAPARMIAWIAGWLMLATVSAQAGDIAALQIIGFSKDGGIFAFEEYGVQDGSGFPYSNIYVLDTKQDSFVAGSPIRIRLDDESASIGAARRQAAAKAEILVKRFGLADNPGLLAAYNPVMEGGDGTSLSYHAHASVPPIGGRYTLSLDTLALPPPETCKDLAPDTRGFRLSFTEEDGKPSSRLIYQDDRLPESRGCALDYRLGAVAIHHPLATDAVHMAMVQVLRYGFEGMDGRWIAVPIPGTP